MPNAPIINDTFFDVDGSVSSIEAADLDMLLESSVEFPTTSSTETREVALRTSCLRHFAGNWSEMSETWQSRLLEPGDVVSHTQGSKKVYLVVRSSTWGAVGYPLSVLGLSSNNVLKQLVREDSRYEYFAVSDASQWKSLQMKVTAPGQSDWKGNPGVEGLIVVRDGDAKGKNLLSYCLQRGFRGLTLTQLRRLASRHIKLEGEKKSATKVSANPCEKMSADAIVKLFAKQLLKDDSDATVKTLLEARDSSPLAEYVKAPILDDCGHLAGQEDSAEEDLEVLEDLECYKHVLSTLQSKKRKSASSMPATRKREKEGKQRRVMNAAGELPWRANKSLTFHEAKGYFPPRSTPVLEHSTHYRWKVSAPYMSSMRSMVIAGRDNRTQDESLRYCLQEAWAAYTAKTGEPCPYNIDASLE
eukprot:6491464-Amphidinium_carterae.3